MGHVVDRVLYSVYRYFLISHSPKPAITLLINHACCCLNHRCVEVRPAQYNMEYIILTVIPWLKMQEP